MISSTGTSIQRKTSVILREKLSYYEELAQAQEAAIANLQAMLQHERFKKIKNCSINALKTNKP